MDEPFYRVNGVDFLPFLTENGITWSEEDIDAENSGRTMDGVMHRGLVARKDKHKLSFRALSNENVRIVTNALDTEYLTVTTNVHPKKTGFVSMQMYNSSRTAAAITIFEDGDVSWQLQEISIIER